MSKTARQIQRFGAAPPFPIAMAVRAGDFVFTSNLGHKVLTEGIFGAEGIPEIADPDLPFADEAKGTFAALVRVLAEADCELADVVDIHVWLRDPRDFTAMNAAFVEAFGATRPARTVLQNHFMLGYRIETKAVAYRPL